MKKSTVKTEKKTMAAEPDKHMILERALNEKQLSREDYDMWRHVYEMQKVYKDMPEATPVSRKKRRRSMY